MDSSANGETSMTRMTKILWLLLIIVAIGFVAVATRTQSTAAPSAAVEPAPDS